MKLRIAYPYEMSFKEYSWTQDEYIEEWSLIYTATIEVEIEIILWIMGMGISRTILEPLKLKKIL